MTNLNDSQDIAEALDDDKLPGDTFDSSPEPEYPLDEPLGLDQYGLTEAEDQIPEPIAESLARERPDPLVAELEHKTLIHEEDQDRNAQFSAEEAAMHEMSEQELERQSDEGSSGDEAPGEGIATDEEPAEPNEPA